MVRLLCLTADATLIRQVRAIFSDIIGEVVCKTAPGEFWTATSNGIWDVLFIDVDLLATPLNPAEVLSRLGIRKKVLVVASTALSEWQRELRDYGAIFLHKPISAGEVGLALRRLVFDDTQSTGTSK